MTSLLRFVRTCCAIAAIALTALTIPAQAAGTAKLYVLNATSGPLAVTIHCGVGYKYGAHVFSGEHFGANIPDNTSCLLIAAPPRSAPARLEFSTKRCPSNTNNDVRIIVSGSGTAHAAISGRCTGGGK